MMLDNFFTLTEMNNGLMVPTRVKELVDVMQKETDCVVKNVGEATRQWSAVGNAIAATENKDCLDLFVHLDGLHFLGRWLKNAHKFGNDFPEDSIIHLLQALGKLPVDYQKLVGAEIWTTVENFLVHDSSKVQDKAQELFESWKKKRDCDESLSDVEKFGALTDDDVGKSTNIERVRGNSESSQKDDSFSRESSFEEKGQGSIRDDSAPSASCDALCSVQVEKTHDPDKDFDPSVGEDTPAARASSPSPTKPVLELPLCHSTDATSVESSDPALSREDTLNVRMEFHELKSPSNIKHTPKIECSPDKSGSVEEFNSSGDRLFPACSDAADAMKSVAEPSSQKSDVAGNKSLSDEGSMCIDSKKNDTDGKYSMDEHGSADQCRNLSASTTGKGCESRKLCKSSSTENSWEITKAFGASRSGIEDHEKMKKLCQRVSDDNLANKYKFAKKRMHRELDRDFRKSDAELYGIIDPLEVARQVAIEVEREVGDYGEHSCSSSGELREHILQQPGSPESVSGKQSHSSEGSPMEVAIDTDLSGETSPMPDESTTSSVNLDPEQTNGMQDTEISQVTEAAREEPNAERAPYTFDLNEEVCSEDADHSMNQFFTPVSVVSASRAAAPPGPPVAPLQFEGNLGWKGSAATSAFRPASPRRLPESEKDILAGESSSRSKQQQRCLDIDLNVAESIDGGRADPSPYKSVLLHSSLPFGESFAEKKQRRYEHLDLDLNLTSEDGARPSDLHIGQFFPQENGWHNPSHSSSSSSKQPSLKNIDLNDQPSFLNDSSDSSHLSKLSQNLSVSGAIKSDNSAISIMGMRVEVGRKDFVSPNLSLPNSRTSGVAFDVNMGSILGMGSVLPLAHSSFYGYNNMPPGSAMPFSSTIYGSSGPIPYMLDSRNAPVIPQLVGAPSAFPTGFPQPPFFANMTSLSNGVGAVGPSRSSFDLNSGTMVEGGSRETEGFFLNSGRVRSTDEQLRSNAQPTISSVVSGKRKEPENGWEQYPLKHYTPPWK